jgi:hypothetical protein
MKPIPAMLLNTQPVTPSMVKMAMFKAAVCDEAGSP